MDYTSAIESKEKRKIKGKSRKAYNSDTIKRFRNKDFDDGKE